MTQTQPSCLAEQHSNRARTVLAERGRPTVNRRLQIATLILIAALGFVLRLRGLSRVGFNEDEVQKVNAARHYLHGDFSVNLEHPMLMKSMITVSVAVTDFWNRRVGPSRHVAEEAAV